MKKFVLNFLMLILLFNIAACRSEDTDDPRYTRLSDFDYLLVRDTNLKYGFIDSEYNEVIPCQFSNATFFENGLSIVKDPSSNKYGLIDLTGDYVVDAQYDSITSINDSNYFIVQKEDLYALMNFHGVELTEFLYGEIKYGEYEPIVAIKDPETEKWGYLNLSGAILTDFIYDEVYPFNGRQITAVKVDDEWGIVNSTGHFLVSPRFTNVYMSSQNSLISVRLDGAWGLMNASGSLVLPIEYDFYFRFNENGISAIRQDKMYGLVNEAGEIVVDMLYKSDEYMFFPMYLSFPNSVTFNKDQKYYIFDYDGDIIFSSVRYRPIMYNENLILAEDMIRHEEVVINYNSKIIGEANEELTYKVLPNFENFFFAEHIVTRDTGSLFIADVYNLKGDLLTPDPAKYDRYITNVSRLDYIPVEYLDLGAYGLIDSEGNVVFEPEYLWIRIFDDNIVMAKKDRLVCLMDLEGNIILDYKYVDILYEL
ncbi:WG repeat-containing protein [Mycoplasmatota bacterium WC30]